MIKHQYKVDIRWSDEDEAWIARVPELEGVSTHGDTLAHAAEMAEEAIQLHLESLQKHDEPLPEPVALENLSGQYPLRMGKERHQDVLLRSRALGVSVNEYLNSLIDEERENSLEARSPKHQEKGGKKSGPQRINKHQRTPAGGKKSGKAMTAPRARREVAKAPKRKA